MTSWTLACTIDRGSKLHNSTSTHTQPLSPFPPIHTFVYLPRTLHRLLCSRGPLTTETLVFHFESIDQPVSPRVPRPRLWGFTNYESKHRLDPNTTTTPTHQKASTSSHPAIMAQASTPTPSDPSTTYTDPTFSLLNTTCLDLLLIELVPMAYRITSDLAAREEEWMGSSSAPKRNSGLTSNDASSTTAAGTSRTDGGTTGGGGGAVATVDEEDAREAVFHRLEALGYRVGLGVVERYVDSAGEHFYNPEANQGDNTGSHAMHHDLRRPSTRSNSSAKISGHCCFASKSIISRRTIEAYTCSQTTHLSH